MNMKSEPTAEELSQILVAADDGAGRHILLVSRSGEVHLTLLPANMVTGAWDEQNHSVYQFSSETYQPGTG